MNTESFGNIDLSGVTGSIHYDYSNAYPAFSQLGAMIIAFLMLIVFFAFLNKALNPKSKRYRELLTDLYVAGTIKQIAKENSIDLDNELKDFAKTIKKAEINYKSLDRVVESELNEEVNNRFEKGREQVKKEK